MASINGKRVVFTGELESMTRAEAQAKAKALGAIVGSTVNAETDLLVAGPGAGSKLAAALKHGVKVLNEKQWLKIAGGGSKAAPAKVAKTSAKKAAKKTAGKKTAKGAATKSPEKKATQSAGKKAAAKSTAAATAADARSLWALLSEQNLASINQGLELAAALPGEIDGLVEGCSVDRDGKIVTSKRFTGTKPAQPYLNLALLGLLSLAPDRSAAAKLRKSVKQIDMWVEDVPRLAGFTAVTSLRLRKPDGGSVAAPRATDLSRFGPMPKLNSIQLSLDWLTSLEGLDAPRLKEADVSDCGSLTDLTALSGLNALTSLELSSCEKLTDLAPLSGLKALTELKLYYCEKLTDLSPLSGLKALTELKLYYCEKLTDLSPLSGLKALTSLDLSYCKNLTDLGPLAGLPALTSLDLSDCEKLKSATLTNLPSLTSLDLSSCKKLTSLGPLSGLEALTSLNLRGCEKLTDLGPLSGLKALDSLDVSEVDGLAWVDPSCTGATLRRQLRRVKSGRRFTVKIYGVAVAKRVCRISEEAYDYWCNTADDGDLWSHMNDTDDVVVPDDACIGGDYWAAWGDDDLGSGWGVLMGSGKIVVTDGDSDEPVFQCALDPKALRTQGVRADAIEVEVFKLDSSCGAGHAFYGEEHQYCADAQMVGIVFDSSTNQFNPARIGLKTRQVDGTHLLRAITYDHAVIAEGVRHTNENFDVPHYGVMKLPKAKPAKKTSKQSSKKTAKATKKTSKKRSPRR